MAINNDSSIESFFNEFIKTSEHSNYIKTIIAREQRFIKTSLPQLINDLKFNETTFIAIRSKVKNEIIHEIGTETKYLRLLYETLRECIHFDSLTRELSISNQLDFIVIMFKYAIKEGELEIKREINPLYKLIS